MPFTTTDKVYNFTGVWNDVPGVYGIMNSEKQMIYIGETDSFKRRMAEHLADKTHCMHQYGPWLVWAEVISTGQAARKKREQQLIAEYAPPCNN